MSPLSNNLVRQTVASANPGSNKGDRYVLVVEPDRLLRWSLATYLSRWFQVCSVTSVSEAASVLEEHPVDAVIISDEPAGKKVREVERRAKSLNPLAKVIRIVMSTRADENAGEGTVALEKPFELAVLARLLGVYDVPS